MGGEGSGRKPDIAKQMIERVTPIVNIGGEGLFLPNYSGVQDTALKTKPATVLHTKDFNYNIQAAINSLPSTGGTVFIDAGTYLISDTILINKKNTTLCGEGKASIIKLANGANCDILELSGSTVVYCTLKDFAIDGNKSNNTSGRGIYLNTAEIGVDDESFHHLQNIQIRRCAGDGLYIIHSVQEARVDNVRIDLCDGYGYNMDGHDHKFHDSVVSSCVKSGLFIHDTAGDCIFNNIKFYHNATQITTSGAYANIEIEGSGHHLFTGCESQNSKAIGWYIHDDNSGNPYMIQLVGCKSESNCLYDEKIKAGVYINNRDRVQIIGGEYSELGAGHQDYGVLISGSSTNCAVIGVECHGSAVAQIYDKSTGQNMILANQGYTIDNLQNHELQLGNAADTTPTITASGSVFVSGGALWYKGFTGTYTQVASA